MSDDGMCKHTAEQHDGLGCTMPECRDETDASVRYCEWAKDDFDQESHDIGAPPDDSSMLGLAPSREEIEALEARRAWRAL